MSRPAAGPFLGRRVVVDVPATAANLGAGYDCVGMALDFGLRVAVEAIDRPGGAIELTIEGEGAGELPGDRSNRVVQALDAGLAAAGVGDPSSLAWRIHVANGIPLSRGLGSSAAATIAGIVAADAVTRSVAADVAGGSVAAAPDEGSTPRAPRGGLKPEMILEIATTFEGHPDNAAPALLGGFTVAGRVAGPDGTERVEAVRFDLPAALRAVLLVPDLPLATSAMRAALPATVPHADAVHNLVAVGLGVAGIASGRYDLLRALTVDRIHEPYRAAVYPELPGLVAAAREAGAIGACLSGAGSTVLAFVDDAMVADRVAAALRERAAAVGLAGRARVALPQAAGARIVESA